MKQNKTPETIPNYHTGSAYEEFAQILKIATVVDQAVKKAEQNIKIEKANRKHNWERRY